MGIEQKIKWLVEVYLPAKKWDEIDALLSDEVTYTASERRCKGKENVMKYWRQDAEQLKEQWQGVPTTKVINLIASADLVAAEWRVEGTLINGEKARINGITVFKFAGAQVSQIRDYCDMIQYVRLAQQYPEIFGEMFA